MLWLSRPPYLRWGAAGVLVLLSLVLELRPPTTSPHPFTARPVVAGETLTSGDVEWRDLPLGTLPAVSLPIVATRAVAAGEPLLPSDAVGDGPSVPPGWWALELPVPEGAAPGHEVLVVVGDGFGGSELESEGRVVALASGDGFGPPPALVAVPGEAATGVAVAAAESRVTVLLGAPGNVPPWTTPRPGG